MSDGQIAVEMSLKEAKFVTGILNAARAQDKLEDGFTKSAAKAAKLDQEIKRFADSTNKVNATPLEAYNQTVTKLDQSLQKNLITQDIYNRALEQAKTQMAAADGSAKRLADDEAKLADEARKAANALKQQQDELSRFADATRKLTAAPVEVYQQRVQELDAALQQGAISQETFTRAVSHAQKEMQDADGTTKRLADDEAKLKKEALDAANNLKKEGDAVKRFAEETKRVNATPIERYEAQVRKLKVALDAGELSQEDFARATATANKELESSGKSGNEAFGSVAIGNLASYAAGVLSVGGAFGAITSVLTHAKKEAEDALETLMGNKNADRDLNQIAESDEELAAMFSRADQASLGTGVKQEEAKRVLLEAYNQGFEKDYEYIMQANQVFDPVEAGKVAGKVPKLFNGAVSSKESLNMALVASQLSEMDFSDMSSGIATAAVGAGMAGASPAETMAAQAVLASHLKNGSQAGERINTFGMKISRDEFRDTFQGKSLLEAAEMMSKDAELKKSVLGDDQEGNAAQFLLFQQKEKILEAQKKIEQAGREAETEDSAVLRGVRRAQGSDRMAATKLLDRSEAARDIAQANQLATGEAARQAAFNQGKADQHNSNAGMVSSFFSSAAGGAAGLLRMDPEVIRNVTNAAGTFGQIAYDDSLSNVTMGAIPKSGVMSESKEVVSEIKGLKDLVKEQTEIMKSDRPATQASRDNVRMKAALPATVN